MKISELLENRKIKMKVKDYQLERIVPEPLLKDWTELFGYDENGRLSDLWTAMTDIDEPNSFYPDHRREMVRVANAWFRQHDISGVEFVNCEDDGDELEWTALVDPSLSSQLSDH